MISIHLMLLFNPEVFQNDIEFYYFNTSNVTIQQQLSQNNTQLAEFQYI